MVLNSMRHISTKNLSILQYYTYLFLEAYKETEYYNRSLALNIDLLPDCRIDLSKSGGKFVSLYNIGINEVQIKKELICGIDLIYTIIFYVDTKFLLVNNLSFCSDDLYKYVDLIASFLDYSELNYQLKISTNNYMLKLNDSLDLDMLLFTNLGETNLTKNLSMYSYYINNFNLYMSYVDFKRLCRANINIFNGKCINSMNKVFISCQSYVELKNLCDYYLSHLSDFLDDYEYYFTLNELLNLKSINKYLKSILKLFNEKMDLNISLHELYGHSVELKPVVIKFILNNVTDKDKYINEFNNIKKELKSFNISLIIN